MIPGFRLDVDQHFRTFSGKPLGHGSTDSLCGTRDDGHMTLESHLSLTVGLLSKPGVNVPFRMANRIYLHFVRQ